jgi:uncharacterized protein YdiU (UPF0061 family)
MLAGFIHGVMNTDNMTISGETIDYGPCAFLDTYDPATVYSSIDHAGRYAFGNQPVVAQWNLARLAETLLPLIESDQERAIELAVASLDSFPGSYNTAWAAGVRDKLGLVAAEDDGAAASLGTEWLSLMGRNRVDHTAAYRALAIAARGDAEPVRGLFLDLQEIDEWLDRWRAQLPDGELMDRTNPVYIPRNHLVEEALTAATAGDLAPCERLLEAITAPYVERAGLERYAQPAPDDFGAYQTFCGT